MSPVLCAVLLGVIWRNTIGLNAGFVPGLQWITNNLLRIGIALVGLKLSLSGLASTASMALPVVIVVHFCSGGRQPAGGPLVRCSQPLRLAARGRNVCLRVHGHLRDDAGRTRACGGKRARCYLRGGARMHRHARVPVARACDIRGRDERSGRVPRYVDPRHVAGDGRVDDLRAAVQRRGRGRYRGLHQAVAQSLVADSGARLRNVDGQRRHARKRTPSDVRCCPAFLIAFVLLALVRTGGDAVFGGGGEVATAWSQIVAVGLGASDLFLVCGMTAIGLSVSLADLRGVGLKALLAALIVAVSVCACSLGMTLAMQRLI